MLILIAYRSKFGHSLWLSIVLVSPSFPDFIRFKVPDPVPREIEGKPFSNPPTDPLHPHTVQPRTKTGGHDAMSMYPQARSQAERPDPSGASRTGGAPLRRFTGTSLPNSKVGGNKREVEWFSVDSCKTKTKPITCQLDYSANLKTE